MSPVILNFLPRIRLPCARHELQGGHQRIVHAAARQKRIAHTSDRKVAVDPAAGFGAISLYVAAPAPDDAAVGLGADISQPSEFTSSGLYGSQAVQHKPVQLVEVVLYVAYREYLRRPTELPVALVEVSVDRIDGSCERRAALFDCAALDLPLEGRASCGVV